MTTETTTCFCLACNPTSGEIGRECIKPKMMPYLPKESTALEWLEGTGQSLFIAEFGRTKRMREIGIRGLEHAIKKSIEFIKECKCPKKQ